MSQPGMPSSILSTLDTTLRNANAILLDPSSPSDFVILTQEHTLPTSWADRLAYLQNLPPTAQSIHGLVRHQELQPADSTGRPYFLYPTLTAAEREAAFIILIMSTLPDWIALIPMADFLRIAAEAPQGKAYL